MSHDCIQIDGGVDVYLVVRTGDSKSMSRC